MALVPRHFFERLPGYCVSKFTWVKTPLKFLTTATSALAVLYFTTVPDDIIEGAKLEAADFAKVFLVLALVSPILIPFACGVLYLLLRIFSVMPQVKVEPALTARFLIPLSPLSYQHVEPMRFFWSIFYYGVHFCIGLYLLVLAADLSIWLFSHTPTPDPGGSNASTGVFIGLAVLSVVLVGYVLLIMPYVELLRAAAPIQSSGMHRVDAHEIQRLIARLSPAVLAKPGRTRRLLTKALVSNIDALEQSVNRQRWKMASLPAEKKAKAVTKRAKIYEKVIKVEELAAILDQCADGSSDQTVLAQQVERLRAVMAADVDAPTVIAMPENLIRA